MEGTQREEDSDGLKEEHQPETLLDYLTLPVNEQYMKYHTYRLLPWPLSDILYIPYMIALFLLAIPYGILLALCGESRTVAGLTIGVNGIIYWFYGMIGIKMSLTIVAGAFVIGTIVTNPSNTDSSDTVRTGGSGQSRGEKYTKWYIWYK